VDSKQIGKYRIIARLGKGGMATVFLCVAAGPVGFNKLLVLKLLRPELADDDEFLAMFVDEARLAARLNHGNVVQTYEVGFEDGHHFLAMDFLDGQPLYSVLRRQSRQSQAMPLDVHVHVLAETLAGLHYAHTLTDFDGTPLNVVHRDVSPQNVFVTYDGQVKLVDFGIAKAAGAATVTQSGVFKGKASYMAPEQASSSPVDARADVFSVGVMLWEAIAGRRFAHGDSQTAVLARRMAGTEPRVRDIVPDAEPELADICDRAMALDREARFVDAQHMHDALDNYLQRSSRRIGPREVGDLVSELFAEERAQIRTVIDQQMKQMQRETMQGVPVPSLEPWTNAVDHTPSQVSVQRQMLATPHPPLSSPENTGPTTLVGSNLSNAPPARRVPTALVVAAFAGVVSLIGVGLAVLFVGQPHDAPAAPGSAEVGDGSEEGATISLELTIVPSSATARLDGVALAQNPFLAQMPRDGSAHTLEVSASGFVTQTAMLSYENDIDMTITLVEATDTTPPATATTTPKAPPRVSGPLPQASPKTSPDPTPPPQPTGKKPLDIDEEDPYR